MDVQNEINIRLDAYIKSEKFEEKMQDIVEKTVNDAVHSLFSFGEIRDTIKEMFKEKISIDVGQMDFAPVNQIVTDLVKQKTTAAFSEPLREKLAAELDDMFAPAPKEITVQGIIDILREELREDCCADPEKAMTVEIEEKTYNSGKVYGYTFKVWNEGRYSESSYSTRRENSANLHMYIRGNGQIGIIHNLDTSKCFGTGVHGFDAKMFMMYCGGTIIKDISECDPDDLHLRINDHIDY